jgi:N utilization substance protein A
LRHRPQVEDLILAARVKAGWITEADLAAEEPEDETEVEAGEAPAADDAQAS